MDASDQRKIGASSSDKLTREGFPKRMALKIKKGKPHEVGS